MLISLCMHVYKTAICDTGYSADGPLFHYYTKYTGTFSQGYQVRIIMQSTSNLTYSFVICCDPLVYKSKYSLDNAITNFAVLKLVRTLLKRFTSPLFLKFYFSLSLCTYYLG